jgi:O-antigen ligase/polysaccharide polymerase Wzy-like membrane protein
MIQHLLLGLLLVAVAAAAVLLLEALTRRAEVGAAFLLGATLLSATLENNVPAVSLPSGIRILVYDAGFALVLAAGVLRMLRIQRLMPPHRWVLVLCVAMLLSLVRGVAAFGVQPAIGEFRLFLAFVAGTVYFATFRPSPQLNARIGKLWLAASVPMMILVGLRWLDTLAGIDLGVPKEQFGADAAVKVLDGPYTFFLATAALLTVPYWQVRGDEARRFTRLGVLLLLFVALLNRRTVWLTMIIGIAVLMMRGQQLRRRTVAIVVGAFLLTAAAYVVLGGTSGEEPTTTSALGTGTLDWRIQGWSELLPGLSNRPVQWLIGEPFGTGFARKVQGTEVLGDPHNFYVSTLLRAGLVGLVALIALSVGLLWALRRTPAQAGGGLLTPAVIPALLAMQAVWFLAWEPGMEQGIVTGLAVGLAVAHGRRVVPVPQRPGRPPVAAGLLRPRVGPPESRQHPAS